MKLAWLDARRQLHLSLDGGPASPTPPGGGRPVFAEWALQAPPDLHSWPTWSPDGQWLAAFRTARDGSGSRIVVASADRFSEAESPQRLELPIHLSWSRGGRRLAVLLQQQDRLVLERIEADDLERSVKVVDGAPLFYTWLDDDRVVAHVADVSGPRVMVCSPAGRIELPGSPGPFTAPVVAGDQVVWVAAQAAGRHAIVASASGGVPTRELEVVDGFVAMVSGGDGTVLRAVSQDADGPYTDLRRLDPVSGRSTRLSDGEALAFFPAGKRVVVLRKHPRRGTMLALAVSVDGRDEHLLAELAPSRDLRFWLRFFEQLAGSHPLADPSGATVALPGAIPGRADDDRSRIWLVPVDGGPPTELAEGTFATFGAEPPEVH